MRDSAQSSDPDNLLGKVDAARNCQASRHPGTFLGGQLAAAGIFFQ